MDGTQIIGEVRGNGDTLHYIYGQSGVEYLVHNNTNVYWVMKNLQGDVIGLAKVNADGSATVVCHYTYTAFGELLSVVDAYGDPITDPTHIALVNPLRYRGYYYDDETGFYYLQSRYYDPVIGRFINADGYVSTGQGLLGNNMFAYCGNNPINRKDSAGMFWNEIGDFFSKVWGGFKTWTDNTFGVGIIQAQAYEATKLDTIIYGNEEGVSTSKVICGTVSKPISVYAENANNWWSFTEYKVGIQINFNNGGFSFSTNTIETSLTISSSYNSIEMISGYNKIGYTYKTGVNFKNRSSEYYYHEYLRTIPTATAVIGVAAAIYYTAGLAIPFLMSLGGAITGNAS